MTAGLRAVTADVVAEAIRDVAAASGSDASLGDILGGALAGVIWMWIKAGKEPEDMRKLMHETVNQQFDYLIPFAAKEAVGAH